MVHFIVWIQLKKVSISLVPRGVVYASGHTFPGFMTPSGSIARSIVALSELLNQEVLPNPDTMLTGT